MTLSYCTFEGNPTIYRPGFAWSLIDGKWAEVNSAEVAQGAAVLTKEHFDARFGHLPDLPSGASQAEPS